MVLPIMGTLITTGLLAYGLMSLKGLRVDKASIGIKEDEQGPPLVR